MRVAIGVLGKGFGVGFRGGWRFSCENQGKGEGVRGGVGGGGGDRQRNRQVNAQALSKLPFSNLPFSSPLFPPPIAPYSREGSIDPRYPSPPSQTPPLLPPNIILRYPQKGGIARYPAIPRKHRCDRSSYTL